MTDIQVGRAAGQAGRQIERFCRLSSQPSGGPYFFVLTNSRHFTLGRLCFRPWLGVQQLPNFTIKSYRSLLLRIDSFFHLSYESMLTLVLLNTDLSFSKNTVDPDQLASDEAI